MTTAAAAHHIINQNKVSVVVVDGVVKRAETATAAVGERRVQTATQAGGTEQGADSRPLARVTGVEVARFTAPR